ncbi:acyltransferase [Anditalea andensis]|nr:acyltransferase [Anditalea andensis]
MNFILPFIPETSLFSLKSKMYSWMGVKLGGNVRICSSLRVRGIGNLNIGANTWVGHDCRIISTSMVHIGKNVDIAPNVLMTTGTHSVDITGERVAGEGKSEDIIIGDGTWIASSVTILPGSVIGEKSLVAAGAVVRGVFPPGVLIGGVPAKIIKNLN